MNNSQGLEFEKAVEIGIKEYMNTGQVSNSDVKDTVISISKYTGLIKSIELSGSLYKKANGDLRVNDKDIELKYSKNKGTYLNTSVYNVSKLKIPTPEPLITKELIKGFDIPIEDDTKSILTPQASEDLRKGNPRLYKSLKKDDSMYWKEYISSVYSILSKNDNAYKFFKSCLDKSIADKKAPDLLVVCDPTSNKVKHTFTKKDIMSLINKDDELLVRGKGLKYGKVRVQFGWQSGLGCNPTIRVFI